MRRSAGWCGTASAGVVTGADELVKIAEHDTVRDPAGGEGGGARQRPQGRRRRRARRARLRLFDVKKGLLYSDKIASWGRSSEAVNKLGALSKRGAPYFADRSTELDADKMKINVNNGTLSIARKPDGDYIQFGPHDPADLITKLSPVDYDPEARVRPTISSSRDAAARARCAASCISGAAIR
jgi:putative DNA primase/helicase